MFENKYKFLKHFKTLPVNKYVTFKTKDMKTLLTTIFILISLISLSNRDINICGNNVEVVNYEKGTINTITIKSIKKEAFLKIGNKTYFGTLILTKRGDKILKLKDGSSKIISFAGKIIEIK